MKLILIFLDGKFPFDENCASFELREDRKHSCRKLTKAAWRMTFTLTHLINWHNYSLAKVVL